MRFRFNHLLYEIPDGVVDEIEVMVTDSFYGDYNFVRDGEHLPMMGGVGEDGEKLPTWENLGIRLIDANKSPKVWYVVDHETDEKLRGPYEHSETAGAVRSEMERKEKWKRKNLWVSSYSDD